MIRCVYISIYIYTHTYMRDSIPYTHARSTFTSPHRRTRPRVSPRCPVLRKCVMITRTTTMTMFNSIGFILAFNNDYSINNSIM